MSNSWYYHYQQTGGEDKWVLDLASNRSNIEKFKRPAFVNVLDLSAVPDDNDWTKVRYRGPLYFDFDADGDLELACEQFQKFLDKLNVEFDFQFDQARLFASGGKGFHIEIPQECFIPKLSPTGTAWLPYVYKAMAEIVVVDTLDLLVYTGKRGRMWRTTNVQRSSGKYKVSITLEEAMSMTPDLYDQVVSEPRDSIATTPPSCNSKLAMLFDMCRDKVVSSMKGRKKRQAAANAFLDPWKAAKKHPPSIEALMLGDNVAPGAGFQHLALQLAIYATSVGMPLDEFLTRCAGLCEKHTSDSNRYNTVAKRREELARMWRYMEDNTLYEFAPQPLIKLISSDHVATDLGAFETKDVGDLPPPSFDEDGNVVQESGVTDDFMKGIRKGFRMTAEGMFKQNGENTEPVCRATFRKVEAFYTLDAKEFRGYEFDIVVNNRVIRRVAQGNEIFTSGQLMKKFLAQNQIGYQGGDPETTALLDIMAEKATKNGHVFVYPKEGFFLCNSPIPGYEDTVAKVYLTQDSFISSIAEDDPAYFRLRYKPTQSLSVFRIDLHKAPKLDESMLPALHDLFAFSTPDVLADLIGWFTAAHYRMFYHAAANQFPLLQIYGEAGAGKSQTVWMLAHMHWYRNDINVNSAASGTDFAMDALVSSSTSAPLIIDEYKPREIRKRKPGVLEKLKELFKIAYNNFNVGNRGTLNTGAETPLSLIRNSASSPIVFMGEAIEPETAIYERSICVNLNKGLQTEARKAAFKRLHGAPLVLASLGRAIIETGFTIDPDEFKTSLEAEVLRVTNSIPPDVDEGLKANSARLLYNRAVTTHALGILKHVFKAHTGSDEMTKVIDNLIAAKNSTRMQEQQTTMLMGISEVSKVMSAIARLSRSQDGLFELRRNRDYIVGEGWVELRVEVAYDQYRRYCSSISDTPLFDTLEVFQHALHTYSPVIDHNCAGSELRAEGSNEMIVRMSLRKLNREGVGAFRQ